MKTLSWIVLLIILGGCSTYGAQSVNTLPAADTIAVVSLLPAHTNVPTIGTTMFNNSYKQLTTRQWDVNSYIENKASSLLAESARFRVVRPDIGEIKKQAGVGMADDSSMTGSVALRNGSVTLKQLADATNADLLLVVGTGNDSIFFGRRDDVSGYGVDQHDIFGVRKAKTYLALHLWLLDGKTQQQIAQTTVTLAKWRSNEYWIGNATEFTPENESYTQDQIQQLADKALTAGFRNLNLSATRSASTPVSPGGS